MLWYTHFMINGCYASYFNGFESLVLCDVRAGGVDPKLASAHPLKPRIMVPFICTSRRFRRSPSFMPYLAVANQAKESVHQRHIPSNPNRKNVIFQKPCLIRFLFPPPPKQKKDSNVFLPHHPLDSSIESSCYSCMKSTTFCCRSQT